MTTETSAPPRGELKLTRIFDAPRALVYEAWTNPTHLATWWGPLGFTNPVCEVDARPGGQMKIVMRSPSGMEHPMVATFTEVVPLVKLAFNTVAVDADNNPLLEGVTSVTFQDQGDQTLLTLETYAVGLAPIAAQMIQGMNAGWTQSIDRLSDFTLGWVPMPVFEMSHEFAAPRDLVFKMWTEREHLVHWWVPTEFKLLALDVDFRLGGELRCGIITPDGDEWWSKWVYKELEAPELIVFVNSYTDAEGNTIRHPRWPDWPLEMESRFYFIDQGDSTTVVLRASPLSSVNAERESFATNSPMMRHGWGPTFERLQAAIETSN